MDSKNKYPIPEEFKAAVNDYFSGKKVAYTTKTVPTQLEFSNDCGGETIENLLDEAGVKTRVDSKDLRIEHYKILEGLNDHSVPGFSFMKATSIAGMTAKQGIEDFPSIKYAYNNIVSPLLPEDYNSESPLLETVSSYLENPYINFGAHLTAGYVGTLASPGAASTFTKAATPLLDTLSYGLRSLVGTKLPQYLNDMFKKDGANQTTEGETHESSWDVFYDCATTATITGGMGAASGAAKVWFIPGLNWSMAAYEGISGATIGALQCYAKHKSSNKNSDESDFSYIPYVADTAALLYMTTNSGGLTFNTFEGSVKTMKAGSAMLNTVVMTDQLTKLGLKVMPEILNSGYQAVSDFASGYFKTTSDLISTPCKAGYDFISESYKYVSDFMPEHGEAQWDLV